MAKLDVKGGMMFVNEAEEGARSDLTPQTNSNFSLGGANAGTEASRTLQDTRISIKERQR
jgi:hypothetical protein